MSVALETPHKRGLSCVKDWRFHHQLLPRRQLNTSRDGGSRLRFGICKSTKRTMNLRVLEEFLCLSLVPAVLGTLLAPGCVHFDSEPVQCAPHPSSIGRVMTVGTPRQVITDH